MYILPGLMGGFHQVAHPMYDSDGGGSPSQSAMMKVAKLVDSYLAEIAPDANLKLSKFIALAEILPDYARVVDDGLYRAVDIYLKVPQPIIALENESDINLCFIFLSIFFNKYISLPSMVSVYLN